MGSGSNMDETSSDDRQPVFRETIVFVHVPEHRLFMCGSEPPSIPAMLEALKLFIRESSSEIFHLEIEGKA
jgi:hypothetical protein